MQPRIFAHTRSVFPVLAFVAIFAVQTPQLYGETVWEWLFGDDDGHAAMRADQTRRATIDMSKTVNFVTTNDITSDHLVCRRGFWHDPGGSSGSVVVNKELEVVGLVIERAPLSNDFLFQEEQSHTISVHVDGIMEVLLKIYDADRVAKELNGK